MMEKKDDTTAKTGVNEVIHMELQIDNDWYNYLKNLYPHQTEELISIISGLKSAGMFKEKIDKTKIKNRDYFNNAKWRGLGAIKKDIEKLRKILLNIRETKEDI